MRRLRLAGKEVRDKDRTGRDSLGTFLALVVVVVLPATTSVLQGGVQGVRGEADIGVLRWV